MHRLRPLHSGLPTKRPAPDRYRRTPPRNRRRCPLADHRGRGLAFPHGPQPDRRYRPQAARDRPPRNSLGNDTDGIVGEITALIADNGRTPEMEYLRSLVWEELEQALDELPRAQREVFCLTEFDSLSFRQVAGQTGVSVATLLSRKHAAVRHLRRRPADIYEALLAD